MYIALLFDKLLLTSHTNKINNIMFKTEENWRGLCRVLCHIQSNPFLLNKNMFSTKDGIMSFKCEISFTLF